MRKYSSCDAPSLPGSVALVVLASDESGDLDRLSARTDIYSLGATLFYLLTGYLPFSGDDIGALLRQVQKGEFRRPRECDPKVDRGIEDVCLKAMSLSPDDRYATPRELAEDVERLLADQCVDAYREPIAARVRAGLCAFALVVSRSPLPSYREWKRRHGPMPWAARLPHDPAVVWLDEGQGPQALLADNPAGVPGKDVKAPGSGGPVAELRAGFRGLPGVDAVTLIAFPVEPASVP